MTMFSSYSYCSSSDSDGWYFCF